MSNPPARFQGRSASTPAAASTDATTDDTAAQLAALVARQSALRESRMRREFERDNAQAEVKLCQAQAEEFGVSTVEQLEALAAELHAADARALAEYAAAIDQEEQVLNAITEDLNRIDANA